MKGALLTIAAASLAISLGAGGATARDTQSLSEFLSRCPTEKQQCRATINDIILAAKSSRYACVPHSLSIDDAVEQQLAWLEKTAESNPRFGREDLEDALWTGVSDMWPCPKRV